MHWNSIGSLKSVSKAFNFSGKQSTPGEISIAPGDLHHENPSCICLKQPTSKIVGIPRVDPRDSGCMASSGSVVIQCQGNAVSSCVDVNRMPKSIMEIGACKEPVQRVKKEVQETTVFFTLSFASSF